MMALLPRNLFENNVIRPRSSFTKVLGLNFMVKSRSLLFDKKFGAPGKLHWSTPRIRRLERPARSRRHPIAIVQRFNDCLLLAKMRVIVESAYFFGVDAQERLGLFLARKQKSQTYHYVRSAIGLPCHGQRTKTNARTCKRSRVLSSEVLSLMSSVSAHQSVSLIQYAKHLSAKRADMMKYRMIQDLMRQRRYRPKSLGVNLEEHYEKVYENVIAAKKRRKNPNIRKK